MRHIIIDGIAYVTACCMAAAREHIDPDTNDKDWYCLHCKKPARLIQSATPKNDPVTGEYGQSN